MSRLKSTKTAAGVLGFALVASMVAGPFAGKAAAAPAKPPKHIAITITATVPTGSGTAPILSGGFTNQQSITFAFTSTVANTSFTCSLDGARPKACSSPTVYSALTSRAHRLVVSGNAPGAHKGSSTFNWTVDTTPPPAVTFQNVPSGPVAVSPAITFTGETGDTFTCSIDGATPVACTTSDTGTQNISGPGTDGTHTLTVVPTDRAGNTGSPASTSWVLDTTPPSVLINNPPPDPTNVTSVHVNYSVNDPNAVVTCTLTLNGTTPITDGTCGPTSYNHASGLAAGNYTLVVTATDEVGNQGSDNASWTISASALDVPVLGSVPNGFDNHSSFNFTFSSGTLSSFECSLDPAGPPTFTACTSPKSTGALSDGNHEFLVRGVSGANHSAAVAYKWVIDTVPPVLHVNGVPSGVTRSTSFAPDISVTDTNPTPPTCTLAGPTSGSSCGTYSNLKDGSYTFTVHETDLAGNAATPVVAHWRVDTTAPVAKIALPGSLTGSVHFNFAEQVSGMSKTLVQLTNATTGKAIPATRRCHSTSKVVPCSGPYRSITLSPTSPLIPGMHYQTGILGGIVHDAAGNLAAAASRSFRGQTSLSPTTVAAHYNWAVKKNRKAIGHSYRTEHFKGATSSYAFKGKSLTWWTLTGPGQGRAVVTIGRHVFKVNNYSNRNHTKVQHVFRHLGTGKHTAKIRVLGKPGIKGGKGTSIAVDAFTAAGHRHANPVLKSSWGKFGRAVRADLRGAAVTLTFSGTSFTWRTPIGGTMGIAKVFIDGKLAATVDNYSTVAKSVARTIGHLKDGLHTAKIVVAGRHHRGSTSNQIVISHYTIG